MDVSLEQYRACIGLLSSTFVGRICHVCVSSVLAVLFFKFFKLQYFFVFLIFCLLLFGDIELNSGPSKRESTLSVCHWTLNSVWVDDFSKITQLAAFFKCS